MKAEGDSTPEKVSGDKKRAGGAFFAAKCVAAMPQGRAERGGVPSGAPRRRGLCIVRDDFFIDFANLRISR